MISSIIKLVLISVSVSILAVSTVSATNILILNNDDFGEGLNDSTVVAPVPGNSATRLGAQYLNVFRAAAAYWEQRLDSPVDIRVRAQLNPLFCTTFSATLGSAGPAGLFRDFINAPIGNTWFTPAQANSLAGFDLDSGNDDINMQFNSNIGSPGCFSNRPWWLGINSPAPLGTVSFYDTVLHELAHGLGFSTFVSSTGQRRGNINDVFMLNLFDLSLGLSWSDMNNAQRAISSVNTGNLVWSGAQVNQNAGSLNSGVNADHVQIYAPDIFQGGSSLSHWDIELSPNELMEPFATLTSNDCSTVSAFQDMGWNTKVSPGELNFSRSAYTGFETVGSVNVTVTRGSFCDGFPIGVTVSSSDVSAVSGSDYSGISQTLSWAAGDTSSRTISIPIVDDGFEDGGETFTVSLSNLTGNATLGNIATATVTIQDEPDEELCFPIRAANGNVAVVCL